MRAHLGGAVAPTHRRRRVSQLVTGAALAVLALTFAPMSAADPSDPACAEAESLVNAGAPGEAITTIKELRKAQPAATPSGKEPAHLCATEYTSAARRQAKADLLVRWANQLGAEASASTPGQQDVELPQPVPTACPTSSLPTKTPVSKEDALKLASSAVDAALVCDSQNESAQDMSKARVEQEGQTWAQGIGKDWTEYADQWLDPLVPVLIAILAWTAGILVVARLILRGLGNGPADLLSKWPKAGGIPIGVGLVAVAISGVAVIGLIPVIIAVPPMTFWLGLLLVALGIAVSVLAIGRKPDWLGLSSIPEKACRRRVAGFITAAGLAIAVVLLIAHSLSPSGTLSPHLILGAVLGAIGAFMLAVGWSASRRLTIVSSGDEAPSAEYLRSLSQQLSPDSPRGLEVPRGTDEQILTDVGIVAGSSTPLLAALGRLVGFLRPPAPWALTVSAESKDVVSAELARNHRRIESVVLDRAAILKAIGVADPSPSTDPDAAETPSADTRPIIDLAVFPVAMAVMNVAQKFGDANGLAGATSWRSLALQYLAAQQPRSGEAAKALYAHAVELDKKNKLALVGYWHSLYREADDEHALTRYKDLLEDNLGKKLKRDAPTLWLRALYTRVAIGINLNSTPASDPWLEERSRELLAAVEDSESGVDYVFRSGMRVRAEALALSVPGLGHPGDFMRPEKHGPTVNYSAACYFATATPKDPMKPDVERKLAVRHLKLADADSTLKAWRERDPQLTEFRKSTEYRGEFGKKLPTELLSVDPFANHAARLRSAGLVTPERVSRASVDTFANVGLSRATALWLRGLAELGVEIEQRDDLRDWSLAIVSGMASLGYSARPPDESAKEVILKRLSEALRTYKEESPNNALRNWLGLPPAATPAATPSAHP